MVTRRITFDLDAPVARQIVGQLDEPQELVSAERLHGGSTEVYRLNLAGDAAPLVLKLYRDDPEWAPAKEAMVAGWYSGAIDLPTPRWLTVDESRKLVPLRYAVMTWLPGEPLRRWMPEPGIDDAYRQMGALIRRTHDIPMYTYGYLLADGVSTPFSDNLSFMQHSFERVDQAFREQGGDESLARRLAALADAEMHHAAHSAGPVLCHDDFHQGNVLAVRDAAGDLQLSGLIDFCNARCADPLFDLAKALFCSAHEDPRSAEPLRQGYGPIDHPDPEGALALYTLFHRMSMWAFLSRMGNTEGLDDLIGDLKAMVA